MTSQRPPIVAILGHVDHGKSTLLDTIRKSNIVAGEAGGITQHVGAYEVTHTSAEGKHVRITFIDTPGHEAFGAIRSRSTNMADVAILIVSSEDGVNKQTIEAINLIKNQEIPYVVAVNKIDSPKANVEKTISSLAEHEIFLEGRGGSVPYAAISAKEGTGIDELLELVVLVAELEDFTADEKSPAEGFVVEAHCDPKKGVTATLIITNGTLSIGEFISAGGSFTPVRAMEDANGEKLTEASFSTPVTLTGWNELPVVGASFATFETKNEARDDALTFESSGADVSEETYDEEDEATAIIPLIIKADATGTLDAIDHELKKIKDDRVVLKVLKRDVGNISENDVKATGGDNRAVIVGFNVKVESGAREPLERAGVVAETFTIIYKLTEWLEELILKRRPRVQVEKVQGSLEVLAIFSTTKNKQVVGGKVTEGSLSAGNKVTVKRRGESVGEGTVTALQAQKQSVKEVREPQECGIEISGALPISERDVLEATMLVEE